MNKKNKQNSLAENDKSNIFRLGKRKIKVGYSLSLKEAENFIQHLIEESGGPITIEEVDESAKITVKSTVDDWSEFKQGPNLNQAHLASFKSKLVQNGFLAFEQNHDELKYHTEFRVLSPRYFADFSCFVKYQEIPASYFGSVIAGNSWFVSHRWVTPTDPDPSRIQFEIVREFVNRHQVSGIWYDYSCIPQEPDSPSDQKLFADSLKHMNSLIITTNFLSIESDDYLSRAWCYFERIISELLCCSKRIRVAPSSAAKLSEELVSQFIVEGKLPPLKAEKSSDLPFIDKLLFTGADMFKMMAVETTLKILNSFGFQFGVGTAARFSQIIDFGKFWMIWQILAGSSEESGIHISQLLDANRLRKVLMHRHERFNTHARFFSDLKNRMTQSLDMRIVEQASSSRLVTLLNEVSLSGPVPEAYTKLALIQLVYWIASRDNLSKRNDMMKTEKQKKSLPPRPLCSSEVLVMFALDSNGLEVDDDKFDDIFQQLASELQPQGVWFGSWKVLRVPNMKIEVPKVSGEAMKFPSILLDELRTWDSKQIKPDSMKIVRIREFTDINGFAFVIHVAEE